MASVDLRSKFGPVEQQGAPNSCVAHAATSVVEAVTGVSDLSRLFVYYNARALAGQASFDAGCQPRNAVRGIYMYGAPDEAAYPYDISKITAKPSASVYTSAVGLKSKIKAYQTVRDLNVLKAALNTGLPVMFGFMVPDTFVSQTKYNGVLPMFTSSTKWIGSHAAVACGYDDARKAVLCRNSFGTNWGDQGYFWMDYGWFTSMTSGRVADAWTVIPA
jgi:C1A family cysteine protease